MGKKRFTFCIPNLNKLDFLPECIDSMLAQDCSDWQCVFVDGYSTDGSWEYMQRFAHDPRFKLLRGLKQGMYADWSECLHHVDTEYFYILTSDDTCYPQLVSTTTQALDLHRDIDVCHFKFALLDAKGNILRQSPDIAKLQFPLYYPFYEQAHRRSGGVDFLLHFFYGALYTTITSLVFRSSLIQKLKGFSSDYGPTGDYDWTMRLGLHTDILYLPELLATWRKYDEQADALVCPTRRRANELQIAQKNLAAFEPGQHLAKAAQPQRFKSEQLLVNLKDAYTAARYQQAIQHLRSAPLQGLKQWAEVAHSDGSYIPRKLLRRISANHLFTYSPDQLILSIFADLELQWQPDCLETEMLLSQA